MNLPEPDEIDWADENVVKLMSIVNERAAMARAMLEGKGTTWDDTNYHRGRLVICKELQKIKEASSPPE